MARIVEVENPSEELFCTPREFVRAVNGTGGSFKNCGQTLVWMLGSLEFSRLTGRPIYAMIKSRNQKNLRWLMIYPTNF